MDRKYRIGLYEKALPDTFFWKEILEAAGDAGYDYVEMSIDATERRISRTDMSPAQRQELISLMQETGVPIRSICASALTKYSLGNDKPEYAQRGMEILKKSIKLAEDLGIRIIMIPGYDVYYEPSTSETEKRFLDNLHRATEMAAEAGVILGLETMENQFMNTVEKAMKYVDLCDSPYLKIYPDIGNMTNAAVEYGTDAAEDMKLGRGHIVALHLKETLPGRYREVPYGSGHVDFRKAIETAWSLGVRRYVTEFWYLKESDWKADLKDAYSRMTAILDKQ